MEKIKDYAKRHNVTYEAVRQQVVRYKKDLEGHIIKKKNVQYLDDEAIAFLDEKRQENPVVVIQEDKNETIERLEKENKMLLVKIAELEEESKNLYKRLDACKDEKIAWLEEKNQLLLEVKTEKEKSIWQRLFRKE